jgi:hypothetical protein
MLILKLLVGIKEYQGIDFHLDIRLSPGDPGHKQKSTKKPDYKNE